MKSRKLVLALALLGALGAGGCDGGPNLPPVDGSEGAARFTYSGARSGSFTAAGVPDPTSTSYAYARPSSSGWMDVTTTWVRSNGSRIRLSFAFPTPTRPTTVEFDWSECPADGFCPGGIVIFTPPPPSITDESGEDVFSFARGTIRITSVEGGRIRGIFSGRGNRQTAGGGTLMLSDGAFDVPIVDESFYLP
ncbi:MAG TPA: hypothetical protein VFS20_11495 [Longimicrobium sp.]|nr:hypothetical protein [Longimicrobium sp.]